MQRQTKQKQQIFEALRALSGSHPSAEAVYEEVRKACPTMSKATVYRVLKSAASEGKVLSVDVCNDVNRYDDKAHPHWHIKCTKCGAVGDAKELMPLDLQQYICLEEGYVLTSAALVLSGICAKCNNKNKSYKEGKTI